MDQHKAPLFDKLCRMAQSKRASFHVPGHKFGQSLSNEEQAFLKQAMSIDYTEITGLDDLHQPHGIIEEAQQLAAACFGAERTFFLVNGSTAGNLAMILAICAKDDLIIVQRDVHKSVLHGLMLAGAQAVFLSPTLDKATGLTAGVSYSHVEAALHDYPQAKAVLLTNPSYYGKGIALRPIVELVHRYNIPLLVDEAHGAHYGFHPELPQSALASGADGVVQSTHKMLTALTMGAMLHIQGQRINAEVVQQRLAMVQSSSPSYVLMASLDVSRRLLATNGFKHLAEGIELVQQFKQSMKQLSWFTIATSENAVNTTQDPFKVAITDRTGTLSGYELQHALELTGCMIELADPVYVLLSFSLSTKKKDIKLLINAFQKISYKFSLEKKELRDSSSNIIILPPFTQHRLPVSFDLARIEGGVRKLVRLQDAIHMRSAEMVIPYPPGIPLLYPGEVITAEMVDYLHKLSLLGATFQGASEIQQQRLQIMCDTMS